MTAPQTNSPPISDIRHQVSDIRLILEAAPRFELGVKLLQSLALPLGYAALRHWKGSDLAPKWVFRKPGAKPIPRKLCLAATPAGKTHPKLRIFDAIF